MRIVGLVGTVVVALTLASFAAPALAQEEGVEERAQALYAEGETAYSGGDYESALASFNAAYELIAVPGLLFNIGQCHRKLGHHIKAADYFQRYLVEETDEIGNRAEVKELLVEENKLAEEERAAAAANAPPVDTTPREPVKSAEPQIYEEPLFWGVAGGVALAAIVGGAVLIAVASTPPPAGTLGTFDLRAP
jgi:tetratricopeptide (TPR) repeat protein